MTREEYQNLLEEREKIEKRLKEYTTEVESRFFIVDNTNSMNYNRLFFKQFVYSHKPGYRKIRLSPFPRLENEKNLQLNDYIQMLIDDLESLKEKN